VLIEVNIAGEEQKAGVAFDGAIGLIRSAAALKHIRVRGLMTMPPYSENPEDSRPHYRRLRELAEAVNEENIPGTSMEVLSMGMSGDFEVAIEEGATLVRVGTAIFGARI
jgi:pyridoxal phosphate enzyme (YggS family)